MQQVPAANVTWTEAGTLRHKYSDIGVAVAIEGGLFTPIIRHAELKSMSEISNEMRDLAERARKRRLAPHEYQGGTTSISNLGMYGIKSFDAVINPPHATILAVGMGEKRPVVSGDKVEVATLVTCTLSCDHRVVDGAVGAELLERLQDADRRPGADAGLRRSGPVDSGQAGPDVRSAAAHINAVAPRSPYSGLSTELVVRAVAPDGRRLASLASAQNRP